MKWVFLDVNTKGEDFTLRQLRLSLIRGGHSVGRIQILDGQNLKSPEEIGQILKQWQPDRILWCSITGLPYYELWIQSPWNSVPKIILWFDEPVTPVEQYSLEHILRQSGQRSDFFYAIWDGHWRDEAEKRWGFRPFPIHLSADEEEYRPVEDKSLLEKFRKQKEVVFIGMLHSPQQILEHLNSLPKGLTALGKSIQSRLEDEIYRASKGISVDLIPSWDRLWKDAEQELRPKEVTLIRTECQRDPLSVKNLRWAIWAMAKNAFRIQVLRKTLEVAPLRIFSEQKQLGHTNEAEWRELLNEQGPRLQVVDTSDWKSEDLGKLHHEGTIQIQATDPQSVRGGIPYRVFQTAASGRALLTDLRPELIECFEPGKEILGYTSASDFIPALNSALSNFDRLLEIGRAARARFEREHTWKHRLASIEDWISRRNRAQRMSDSASSPS